MDTDSRNNDSSDSKRDVITIDRGLAHGGQHAHGLNRSLLMEKILRERILDSPYWYITVVNLQFFQILDECVSSVGLIGSYVNNSKTRPCKFICLLFRLLQLPTIPGDVVEWVVVGNHGFKYLTVLFMLYARLIWEDQAKLWVMLESRFSDYRKIRTVQNGKVGLSTVDQMSDALLYRDTFFGMALPRLVNRWVLEEAGVLEERESELMDEFEQEVEGLDEDQGQGAEQQE